MKIEQKLFNALVKKYEGIPFGSYMVAENRQRGYTAATRKRQGEDISALMAESMFLCFKYRDMRDALKSA